MDKTAQTNPMKRGYIVKGALRGAREAIPEWATVTGALGTSLGLIPLVANAQSGVTKKDLGVLGLGAGGGIAAGAGLGAVTGAIRGAKDAREDRIKANISKTDEAHLQRLWNNQEDAWRAYSDIDENDPRQHERSLVAKKKYDALEAQYNRAHAEAMERSKQDLLQRKLLKRAQEERNMNYEEMVKMAYEEIVGGMDKEAGMKQIGQDAWQDVKKLAPLTAGLTATNAGVVGMDAYRKARQRGLSKKDALKFAVKRGGKYSAVTLPTLTALNALGGAVLNGTNEPGILNPHLKK